MRGIPVWASAVAPPPACAVVTLQVPDAEMVSTFVPAQAAFEVRAGSRVGSVCGQSFTSPCELHDSHVPWLEKSTIQCCSKMGGRLSAPGTNERAASSFPSAETCPTMTCFVSFS